MSKLNNLNKIYKISGMDCPSCAMLIESELEDAGVKAKVSYARQTLEVEGSENASANQITKIVSSLGYKLEG
jgi:Zn2+/Cd2+-exporting ATPase